ncbi:FixH family protein [Rhodobacteraceae bacterium NNCM2]|nr:FixH family protein [Coraliihabitans acroporae]
MSRQLTGRHVLIIAVTAFAIIIAANMAMLFAATGTFPGLVVGNSYVASQKWNAKTDAQKALGWTADVSYDAGQLLVTLVDRQGTPVSAPLMAEIGRPSSDVADREFALVGTDAGYELPIELDPGIWRVHVRTESGTPYEIETRIMVPERR